MSIQEKKRDKSIDFLRGIGILFMVVGHLGTVYTEQYIYAFHMPLFFFISGIFADSLRKQSFLKMLLHKARALLIPYLVFGILAYLIWYAMQILFTSEVSNSEALRLFTNIFWMNTRGMAVAEAIWFLSALFFLFILYWLLVRLVHNVFIQTVISFALALLGMILPTVYNIRLPWAVDIALVGIFFYCLAHCIFTAYRQNKYKPLSNLLEMKWWMLVIMMPIHFILCLCNDKIGMYFGWYGNFVLFFVNAILGCVLYYNFSHLLYCTMKKRKFGLVICNVMEQIGEKSIIFVGLNQIVIIFVRKLVHPFLPAFIISIFILYWSAQIIYFFIGLYNNIRRAKNDCIH